MKTAITTVVSLAIGAGGLGIAAVSYADSSAAHKLGQIGVINQTLQPKPPKSSPAYSNSNSTSTINPATGAAYGNTANGVNGQNSANAAANAGATARAGAASRNSR